jgi:hypothetical protein
MERDETYAERMNHMERAEPCGGMNPVETGAFAVPLRNSPNSPQLESLTLNQIPPAKKIAPAQRA